MFSIHDEQKVIELLEKNGHKKFRYAQIENALYKNLTTDFSLTQTLPKDIRTLLSENCFYTSLTLHSEKTDPEWQTTKFLFKTADGKMIEAVIMRHLSGRNTLCVSSQAWCPMACSFCATGKLWLIRNLEFYEIIDQIMWAVHHLAREEKKLRNIVYMWMGEPLLNYEHVKKSIHIACSQKKLDLSNRRITVSTCGIAPRIIDFAHDFPQVSLAVSLHAPNDAARKKIMPVENTYPIDVLMNAIDEYVKITNKRVFYEYIMINGVTDRLEFAKELALLLKWRLAHVNFIPYNPGEWTDSEGFMPTSKMIIKKFQDTLESYGIPSTVRHTMWDDIDAACGQLALKEEGKSLAEEKGRTIKK